MPCVYAVNKIDAITMEELDVLDAMPHYCPISSHYKWNLDGLMDKVFEYLAITRVYTKPKGQMPDYSAPVILRGVAEPTVELFCKKIHRTLINDFKYAWVWGSSVKHNPGPCGQGPRAARRGRHPNRQEDLSRESPVTTHERFDTNLASGRARASACERRLQCRGQICVRT